MANANTGTWNPGDDAKREEYWRLESRAAGDANTAAQMIWRDGLPDDGDLRPIANEWTNAYVAQLRQESAAIPRWAFASQDVMREFVRQSGHRYYWAFLRTLARIIGGGVETTFRLPPRTTPLPQRRYQTNRPRRHDEEGA